MISRDGFSTSNTPMLAHPEIPVIDRTTGWEFTTAKALPTSIRTELKNCLTDLSKLEYIICSHNLDLQGINSIALLNTVRLIANAGYEFVTYESEGRQFRQFQPQGLDYAVMYNHANQLIAHNEALAETLSLLKDMEQLVINYVVQLIERTPVWEFTTAKVLPISVRTELKGYLDALSNLGLIICSHDLDLQQINTIALLNTVQLVAQTGYEFVTFLSEGQLHRQFQPQGLNYSVDTQSSPPANQDKSLIKTFELVKSVERLVSKYVSR